MMPTSRYVTVQWTLVMLIAGLAVAAGVAVRMGNVPARDQVLVSNLGSASGSFAQPADINGGIGILGDSNSDEYRADDNRGGAYAATTLNWMEQLVRSRGLDFGDWGTRAEPRRSGYEYNWARSGAKTHDVITAGQHTGVAQQVADGRVRYALMFVGNNDFHLNNGTYGEIYDGTLSGTALQVKIDRIIAETTLAVDTILGAGQVQMVVANIADPGGTPEAIARFPDPAKRQRVTDAIDAINVGVEAMAASRDVAIADMHGFAVTLIARLDDQGRLHVGGELIDMLTKGNEPHHARLDDPSGHAGTVLNGLIANSLFIEPFNSAYGLDITPLSDEEILRNAGIIKSKRYYVPIILMLSVALVGAWTAVRHRSRLLAWLGKSGPSDPGAGRRVTIKRVERAQ